MDDVRTLIHQIQTGIEVPQNFGFLDTFVDIWQWLKIEWHRFHDVQIDWVRWDTDDLRYWRAKELAALQIPKITPFSKEPLSVNAQIIQDRIKNRQANQDKNIFDIYAPMKDRLEALGFRFFKNDLSRIIKCIFTKKQRKSFTFEKTEKPPLPSDSVLIAAAIKSELFFVDDIKQPKKEQTYQIWCDSSYLAVGKVGGWGAVIIAPDGTISEDSGGFPFCQSSTEGELWGITFALENIPDGFSVEIYCDCRSAVNSVQGLAWKSEIVGCLVSYKEVAPYLKAEIERLDVVLPHWVKGHSDYPFNNRADELAGIEARRTQGKGVRKCS